MPSTVCAHEGCANPVHAADRHKLADGSGFDMDTVFCCLCCTDDKCTIASHSKGRALRAKASAPSPPPTGAAGSQGSGGGSSSSDSPASTSTTDSATAAKIDALVTATAQLVQANRDAAATASAAATSAAAAAATAAAGSVRATEQEKKAPDAALTHDSFRITVTDWSLFPGNPAFTARNVDVDFLSRLRGPSFESLRFERRFIEASSSAKAQQAKRGAAKASGVWRTDADDCDDDGTSLTQLWKGCQLDSASPYHELQALRTTAGLASAITAITRLNTSSPSAATAAGASAAAAAGGAAAGGAARAASAVAAAIPLSASPDDADRGDDDSSPGSDPAAAIPLDVLRSGTPGIIGIHIFLGEVASERFHALGLPVLEAIFAELHAEHTSDATPYVRKNAAKGRNYAMVWTLRFTRVYLGGYRNFLRARPATWIFPRFGTLSRRPWVPLRVMDTKEEVDLSHIVAWLGLSKATHLAEKDKDPPIDPLTGDAPSSWVDPALVIKTVRSMFRGLATAWQKAHVLSTANLDNVKKLPANAVAKFVETGTGRGGGGGGGGAGAGAGGNPRNPRVPANPSNPRKRNRDDSANPPAHPQQRGAAATAGDGPRFTRCNWDGCLSTAGKKFPLGFSEPLCLAHRRAFLALNDADQAQRLTDMKAKDPRITKGVVDPSRVPKG